MAGQGHRRATGEAVRDMWYLGGQTLVFNSCLRDSLRQGRMLDLGSETGLMASFLHLRSL